MLPRVALTACIFLVVTLLVMDRRWRPTISAASWIPVIWVLIIGSRPVSSWFSSAPPIESAADYLEGSPADRMVYQLLIFAGLLVLLSRRIAWSRFFSSNGWLVLYFVYFGISVLWSDYTFVAFKRWVKDFGMLIMILIVLSEEDPVEAIKAVFLRCSYVLIPVSFVFIKYFPDIGRYYDRWTGSAYYCGVTTNKNLLGMTIATCGVFVIWALVELIDGTVEKSRRTQLFVYISLLAMAVWLLGKANSATALACSLTAVAILITLRYRCFRKNIYGWVAAGTIGLVVLTMLDSVFGVRGAIIGLLGRDSSLTGRTDIWDAVLGEEINPVIGTGFYSFWMGERVERISRNYHFLINEAHNGYLELYLNGGFIGLALFVLMILAALRKYLAALRSGASGGYYNLRIAFLVFVILYSLSEAIASRLNLVWFGFLLLVSAYPGPRLSGQPERLRAVEPNVLLPYRR